MTRTHTVLLSLVIVILLAVPSSGQFAYVTNLYSNNVSGYTVNPSTGALAAIPGSPFATESNPGAIAIDPTGKFAYVANGGSNNVLGYTINAGTGALTAIPGSPFPAGSGPGALAVDPAGKFAYVVNGASSNVSGYTIDPTTGALTAIPGSPFPAGSSPMFVAIDPTGRFAYVANRISGNVSGYAINSSTGALTAIAGSPFGAGEWPYSVTVDPTGKFVYVANASSHNVSGYTINAGTGALTAIAGSPFLAGSWTTFVAVDPSGKFAYASDSDGGTVLGFAVNASTGALTAIAGSPFPAGSGPWSVAIDPTGQFVYVVNRSSGNVSAYTMNSVTGALSAVAGSPFAAGSFPQYVAFTPVHTQCVRPPAGMVGWWPGDGHARDLAGGNNGTLQGGATFAAGKVGQAFSLDRSQSAYVEVPDAPNLHLSSGDFTVATWVKFTNPCIGGAPFCDEDIVDKAGKVAGVNDDGWRLFRQAYHGRFWFCFGGGPGQNGCMEGSSTTVESSTVASAGTWYHVAAVKSGGQISIYVNGALDSPVHPLGSFYDTNASNLHFGSYPPESAYSLSGQIDEVAIFNRALTAGEILASFNAGGFGYCKPAGGYGPISDDFNGSTLNTALWTFVNPVGNGSYSLNGSELLLNVPGGSNHDPTFSGVNNSVRVVQPIANKDFTVEVKFDSIPTQKYQFEGILAEQDSANYLRFQFGWNGSALDVDASKILSRSEISQFASAISLPSGTTSLWMLVRRTGNTWSVWWSPDGVNYRTAGSFVQALSIVDVGPFAGNYHPNASSAPAFTAKVGYFKSYSPSTALFPSSITVEASPNPSVFGRTVKLTAKVSPAAATGIVTFYDGTTVLGSAPLTAGTAVLNTILLPAGARSLRAYYGGDVTYGPSTSTPLAQQVTAIPSTTFVPASGSPIAVGTFALAVVAGDFNGDGKADLVVANSSSNTLTVLLGNGGGGFAAASGSPIAVGSGPRSVAVGDFNGDGKMDLAVANRWSNNVTVLLGSGNGGFTEAIGSPIPMATDPFHIAVGDFNGDGKADLAVAKFNGNNVTVLIGNGNGGFTEASGSPYFAGTRLDCVAVGDFNGDGIADLAITGHAGTVAILLGDGSGRFTNASGSPLPGGGGNPHYVVVGDFNGDGATDLAIANYFPGATGYVTTYLGNGNGGFNAATGSPFTVGSGPISLAIGDFNADGKTDFAVANADSANLTVLSGNGAAGFSPMSTSPFAAGSYPDSVVVADFNGDGRLDLAAANGNSNDLTVLLGTAPASPPASDNFNSPTLNTALWNFVNPVGNGTSTLNGSELVLSVPGGSNHDPTFGGVNNSVRVVQYIANRDFTVEVKFDSIPSQKYQFEGILAEQDSANYLRFQFGSNGSSLDVDASKILAHTEISQFASVISLPGGTASLWLRVQRTGNTWTVSWSPNGATYKTAGSFMQALTIADVGPFAGNYHPTGSAAPAFTARVDYWHGAGPVSDYFNSPTLDTALWTFVNPVGNGSYSLNGSELLLNVPAASNHDPAIGGVNNSVRVVQTAADTDFTIEAKFDSIPLLKYQFEGILVEQNADNYLRFEFGSAGGTVQVSASKIVSRAEISQFSNVIPTPTGTTALWLRVRRAGTTWTVTWSPNGTTYNTAGSFTQTLAVVDVGVIAGNYAPTASAAPAFTAKVDTFIVGQISDALGEFSTASNPNGAWSYGTTRTLGGAFTPYSFVGGGDCGNAKLQGWQNANSPPYVLRNSAGIPTPCTGTATVPVNVLQLHPSSDGQDSVVRWTAPSGGSYEVQGFFEGNDFSGPTTTDCHVLVNGVSKADFIINTFNVPSSFNLVVKLNLGDRVDFAVGFGSNSNYISDSTGLSATIRRLDE